MTSYRSLENVIRDIARPKAALLKPTTASPKSSLDVLTNEELHAIATGKTVLTEGAGSDAASVLRDRLAKLTDLVKTLP
jgi:hypothetical protein